VPIEAAISGPREPLLGRIADSAMPREQGIATSRGDGRGSGQGVGDISDAAGRQGFAWKVAHAAKTKVMRVFGGGLTFNHSGRNAYHTVVEFREV
jgi:hypothetical protein